MIKKKKRKIHVQTQDYKELCFLYQYEIRRVKKRTKFVSVL